MTELLFNFHTNLSFSNAQELFIFGEPDVNVTVSNNNGFNQSVTLNSDGAATIEIPISEAMSGTGVNNQGFQITSDEPIQAYFSNRAQATTDLTAIFDQASLGTDYILASAGFTGEFHNDSGQFSVQATENNTQVDVTLPDGQTLNVTINAGETFKFSTQGNNNLSEFGIDITADFDLTGTVISATAPVAVFSGHQSAEVGAGGRDHLIEQMPSMDDLSSSYVVGEAFSPNGLGNNLVRVIAPENGTEVQLDGSVVATLDAQEVYEFTLSDEAAVIETSNPALVAQYLQGNTTAGEGDPAMMFVPGQDNWLSEYQLATPTGSNAFAQNLVNVVIPTSALDSLVLDEVAVDTSGFVSVGTSEFSVGNIPVSPGLFALEASDPFQVSLFGYDSSDSYLTFGAASFATGVSPVPPVATDDSGVGFTTDEETVFITGNVLENDTDENNDSLSVSEFDTTGTAGEVTDNGDGTFTYDPNGQFNALSAGETATDSFTYTVSDGNDGFAEGTVTITIEGINDSPTIASPDTVTVEENTKSVITINVNDPDNDPITFSLSGGADQDLFNLDSNGNLTFINAPDFENPSDFDGNNIYEVEVTADDGNGSSITQTLEVTINDITVPDSPPAAPGGDDGISWGDPHLVTFDGVAYDFQGAGEFVLLRSLDDSVEVQVRQEPIRNNVSVNTAIATELGGQTVMIDISDSQILQINGTPTPLADGGSLAVGNGGIYRNGNNYILVYPGEDGEVNDGDERFIVQAYTRHMNLEMQLSAEREVLLEGLLGNADGDGSNDIATADGVALPRPLEFEDLYGTFRDDWRVSTVEDSLFTYDAGESLETFYNPNFPNFMVSVDSLDPDVRAAAEQAALDAGLTPGTPNFDNAVLDFALTQDETFLESAAEVKTIEEVEEIPVADPFIFSDYSEASVELKLLDENGDEITDNIILGDSFFLEILAGDLRDTDPKGLMAFTYNLEFASDVVQNTNDFSTPADNNNLIPANFPLLGTGTLDNGNGQIIDLGAGSLPDADGDSNGSVIGVGALETFSNLSFNVEDGAVRDDSTIVLTVDTSQTGFPDGKYADPNAQLVFTQDLIINDAPVLDAIADVSLPEDVTAITEVISATAIVATDDDLGNALTFTLTSPDDGNGNPLFSFFDATQTGDDRFVETSPADENNPSQSALPVVVTPTGESVIDFETEPNSYPVSISADDGFKSSTEEVNVAITNVNDPLIEVDVTSVIFGTNLPDGTTSELVRPALPDRSQVVTVTNAGTGTDILTVSDIEINHPHVSINPLWENDVLLNPGESREIYLTYAPEAAGEDFDLADGLVINSNAVNDADVEVALAGKSTYNSDVDYDGTVNLEDLAVLEGVTFPSSVGDVGYEATADINGDGKINRGELIPLNAELFETIN
ncbi:UNVERIFIED_CONTAM: hypothetical protein BEN50_01990 [Euhalothece sp. KZN 001]